MEDRDKKNLLTANNIVEMTSSGVNLYPAVHYFSQLKIFYYENRPVWKNRKGTIFSFQTLRSTTRKTYSLRKTSSKWRVLGRTCNTAVHICHSSKYSIMKTAQFGRIEKSTRMIEFLWKRSKKKVPAWSNSFGNIQRKKYPHNRIPLETFKIS